MTDNTVNSDSIPTNSELSSVLNGLSDSDRLVHEARTLRSSVLQHAKASGINTKAAALVESLLKGKPGAAKDFVSTLVRLAAVAGILEREELQQLSLFDPVLPEQALREQALARARDAGYHAGIHGLPEGDNPYQEGTEESIQWNRCRQKGFDIMTQADGGDTRAVADRRQPHGRHSKVSTTDDGQRITRPRGRPRKDGTPPRQRIPVTHVEVSQLPA